ncbi:hypothetical protein EDD11_009824 [Mortierella claussenii]|nr:hypothetical protein EDD11_009824 [Mortierella claussenii]
MGRPLQWSWHEVTANRLMVAPLNSAGAHAVPLPARRPISSTRPSLKMLKVSRVVGSTGPSRLYLTSTSQKTGKPSPKSNPDHKHAEMRMENKTEGATTKIAEHLKESYSFDREALASASTTLSKKKIARVAKAANDNSALSSLSVESKQPAAAASITALPTFSSMTQSNRSRVIPDYKHSRHPPADELDALQAMIDTLLESNSSINKRAVLAAHPEQAPLLGWIYDPMRQFHVKSARLLKYARMRADERDLLMQNEMKRAKDAGEMMPEPSPPTAISTSVWASSSVPATVADQMSRDGCDHADEIPLSAQGRLSQGGYKTLSELLEALSTRAITGHAALDAVLMFMDRFCQPSDANLMVRTKHPSTMSTQPSSHFDATMQLFATPRSKLLLKILDKNLKTGCSVNMIRDEYPTLIERFHVSLGYLLPAGLDEAHKLFPQPRSETDNSTTAVSTADDVHATSATDAEKAKRAKRAKKQVVNKKQQQRNAKVEAGWFASRKVDGVRCLIRVDRLTGEIVAFSRSGKVFEGLGALHEELRRTLQPPSFERSDGLQDDNNGSSRPAAPSHNWDWFFEQALGLNHGGLWGSKGSQQQQQQQQQWPHPLPESLMLDGEICIFTKEPMGKDIVDDDHDDACGDGTDGDNDDDLGREQFLKAISLVKRDKQETIAPLSEAASASVTEAEPALQDGTRATTIASAATKVEQPGVFLPGYDVAVYCVFDCLTDKEFKDRTGTRLLSERVEGVARALADAAARRKKALEGSESSHAGVEIRMLKQIKIKNYEHLRRIASRSIRRGWEGVVIKKDVAYEGKRSRNMFKIKQFQDAEFKVEEAMLGRMRLPYEGRMEELDNVLTNVVVIHRGNRVRVGSGFTAEDRIKFGKDPSLIVGKTITVKYYEESKTVVSSGGTNDSHGTTSAPGSSDNDDSSGGHEYGSVDGRVEGPSSGVVWSLRFPTVKAIYERERDV